MASTDYYVRPLYRDGHHSSILDNLRYCELRLKENNATNLLSLFLLKTLTYFDMRCSIFFFSSSIFFLRSSSFSFTAVSCRPVRQSSLFKLCKVFQYHWQVKLFIYISSVYLKVLEIFREEDYWWRHPYIFILMAGCRRESSWLCGRSHSAVVTTTPSPGQLVCILKRVWLEMYLFYTYSFNLMVNYLKYKFKGLHAEVRGFADMWRGQEIQILKS